MTHVTSVGDKVPFCAFVFFGREVSRMRRRRSDDFCTVWAQRLLSLLLEHIENTVLKMVIVTHASVGEDVAPFCAFYVG